MDHVKWMRVALELARRCVQTGDVPIGAVVVSSCGTKLLGSGANERVATCDPSAHAEILALRQAGQAVRNWQLPGSFLYVTLEPCPMCLHAAIEARIAHIIFGAAAQRRSVVVSEHINTKLSGGVLEEECSALLTSWFTNHRKNQKSSHL